MSASASTEPVQVPLQGREARRMWGVNEEAPTGSQLLPEQKGNSEAKGCGLGVGAATSRHPHRLPIPPIPQGAIMGPPESQRLPRALTRSPSQ